VTVERWTGRKQVKKTKKKPGPGRSWAFITTKRKDKDKEWGGSISEISVRLLTNERVTVSLLLLLLLDDDEYREDEILH
jgi:hypothetical protein